MAIGADTRTKETVWAEAPLVWLLLDAVEVEVEVALEAETVALPLPPDPREADVAAAISDDEVVVSWDLAATHMAETVFPWLAS